MFHSISRHLEVGLKNLDCASFFNQLLSVWISDETLRVVLDILLLTCPNYMSSIRQGFQARILLFSSLARSPRYINLTDFELLPIWYNSVFAHRNPLCSHYRESENGRSVITLFYAPLSFRATLYLSCTKCVGLFWHRSYCCNRPSSQVYKTLLSVASNIKHLFLLIKTGLNLWQKH